MSNGNGTAPICPVSRSEGVISTPPAQQAIVPATDLPSAIAALNQINLVAQQLKALPGGNGMPGAGSSPASAVGRRFPLWVRERQVIDTVRIYNPGDDQVYVEMERITYLLYREQKTQVTLEWNLAYGTPS